MIHNCWIAHGMASFCYGWPKLLCSKLDKESFVSENERRSPIHLVTDDHRNRLAVLYEDKVVFWSTGRVRVVIGKLCLSSYKDKGSIQGGCFRYDGKRFAILFEQRYLLIFNLEPFYAPPGRSSWFDFVSSSGGNSQDKDNQSAKNCSEEYILPTILVEKYIGTNEEEFILSCKSLPFGILVVTSNLEMYFVSWEGEVVWNSSMRRLLANGDNFLQGAQGVISLDYHKGSDLCGLALEVSGIAILVRIGEGGHILPETDDTFILRESDASCIALEPQQCLAAVGLKSGSVEIYNTSVFITGQPVCLRVLSLESLYISVSDTGGVVSVQWTSDGNCVAVGYEKAGVVVWSTFGHCLFHSFSTFERPIEQVGFISPSLQKNQRNYEQIGENNHSSSFYEDTERNNLRQGYLFRHVKDICWGPFGYSLFVLGDIEYERDQLEAQLCGSFYFLELNFLKTGFCKGSCQNETTRKFLLGPDFFVFEDNAQTNYPPMISSKKKWMQHVEAPYEYVSSNWPLRFISANDDKSFVAVSGKHGVAIYNIRSKRWRLFGDVVEERMIQCCSLCWYGRSIIIGNEIAIQNRKTFRYELMVFPRDSLYFSAIQVRIPLEGAPLLLDARNDGFILVFADDLQLRLLQLKSDRSKANFTYSTLWTFHITVEAPLASPRRITKWRSTGTFVSSVRIYPPRSNGKDIPQQVLLLKSTGSLILLDIPKGISVPLLRMVHSFWFHYSDCFPIEETNSQSLAIWAVSEDGIYCLFDPYISELSPFSTPTTESPSSMISRFVTNKWFQWDINVYPLGAVEYGGFLAGVCPIQTTNLTIALNNIYCRLPCFGIQIERQEFMSKLFLSWLADETLEDMQCLKWMESCSRNEHFEDCLERCLYELLVQVETKRNNSLSPHEETFESPSVEPVCSLSEGFALDRFMRLVKYFGEYEDVIVGCARKMDHKYWNLLFSYVGEPCLLFENCCLTNRLTTAAAFLKIIQEWWDFQVAVMHAWRLLQCCLKEGRIDIAEQVVAFLDRAFEQGLFSIPEFDIGEEEKRLLDTGIVIGGNKRVASPMDALLLQHLGICFERKQWKLASSISMCFGISLADYWKAKETTSFQNKHHLLPLLLSLHDSFQWPFPSPDIVEKKWNATREQTLSNDDNVFAKLLEWKDTTHDNVQGSKMYYKNDNEYYKRIRRQLKYLTGNAFAANQWELVLCGLTMLLSCEELQVLMNRHVDWIPVDWIPSYKDALEKSHVGGYVVLASKWG